MSLRKSCSESVVMSGLQVERVDFLRAARRACRVGALGLGGRRPGRSSSTSSISWLSR